MYTCGCCCFWPCNGHYTLYGKKYTTQIISINILPIEWFGPLMLLFKMFRSKPIQICIIQKSWKFKLRSIFDHVWHVPWRSYIWNMDLLGLWLVPNYWKFGPEMFLMIFQVFLHQLLLWLFNIGFVPVFFVQFFSEQNVSTHIVGWSVDAISMNSVCCMSVESKLTAKSSSCEREIFVTIFFLGTFTFVGFFAGTIASSWLMKNKTK